jgi:crAss001_48 related protein
MSLQDFEQRVIDEKTELDEKLDRLELFIDHSSDFTNLTEQNKQLLIAQKNAMLTYSNILGLRISLFDID